MTANKKMIVIEDDSAVQKLIKTIFKKSGYNIVCASTGKEGVEKIALAPPDILLLDMNLPDMHGLDILRKVRADGHKFPVIVVTASEDFEQANNSLNMGANGYIIKPFEVANIKEVVRKALEKD